eukprot:15484923-Alexandrium_andersonii.AAC.1
MPTLPRGPPTQATALVLGCSKGPAIRMEVIDDTSTEYPRGAPKGQQLRDRTAFSACSALQARTAR